MAPSPPYFVDPADPRAPSLEVWEKLTAAERQRAMDQLLCEVELGPPALVPELAELVSRANALADDLQSRLEQLENQLTVEQQRAESEQQRAESEQQRAENAEARIAELEAELARLRSEPGR